MASPRLKVKQRSEAKESRGGAQLHCPPTRAATGRRALPGHPRTQQRLTVTHSRRETGSPQPSQSTQTHTPKWAGTGSSTRRGTSGSAQRWSRPAACSADAEPPAIAPRQGWTIPQVAVGTPPEARHATRASAPIPEPRRSTQGCPEQTQHSPWWEGPFAPTPPSAACPAKGEQHACGAGDRLPVLPTGSSTCAVLGTGSLVD